MALNSINTNIAALAAQGNITKANDMTSSSIARLSSGNRIVQASDDVAAMSAGTSLRTNVTTLRMALINTSQGESLLQVADGALNQITDILQRQKAIAVQSGSGSLTAAERSFLNQEFQNLTEEIDRLADQTNFNGVSLLNGELSERVDVEDNSTAATSATATIAFQVNVAAGETLVLNGVTVTEGANYNRGLTIDETVDNLVTFLNASTNVALSQATYERSGNSLVITADNGGVQGQVYTIDADASTAIDGTGTGRAVVSGGGAATTITLFDGAAVGPIAATSTTEVVAIAAANVAADTPFGIGETITADLGGGAQNLHTIAANDTLEDIVNGINANTGTHGITARIIGSAGEYNLQFETTALSTNNDYDVAGNGVDITLGGIAATVGIGAAFALEAAGDTENNATFALFNADDAGIGAGDVVGAGTIGDNILTGQNQQQAEVRITFPEIADADLSDATNFGQANNSTFSISNNGLPDIVFGFSESGDGPAEGQIGATLEETLDNVIAAFNSYEGSASENHIMNQLEAYRDGRDIVIRSIDVGNPADITGTALTITGANLPTGASVSGAGTLSNGQTGGISASGITNSSFIGTISGFSATYTGTTDTVDLSVTVGAFTYTASNANVNVTADTTVRFASEGGGYFDVQLAANQGQSVTTQAEADTIADRINAAFSSVEFTQERSVSSYTGNAPIVTDGVVTGSLLGTSVDIRLNDFTDVRVDSIRVSEPEGVSENGSIEITLNGQAYTAVPDIGSTLAANQTYRLTSTADTSSYIDFTTGNTAIEFDTLAKAQSFEQALREAFGVSDSSAAVNFQVGVTTTDTLQISVDSVTTRTIYDGASLDVLTAESAATAAAALDVAIDAVTAVRAEVGALQSRFNFAAANVESSIANQDAARGVLLDTDIAAESTAFATAQVQLQAGISVLAQANLLPQNLLKLIG